MLSPAVSRIAICALFLLALWGRPAAAQTFQCASFNQTVTGVTSALGTIAPGTALGAALGAGPITVTSTLSNCSMGPNQGPIIFIGFGTALTPANGITGINYQIVGAPSFTTSGSCPPVLVTQNASDTQFKLNTGSTGFTGCSLTTTVKGRLYLGAARVTGKQVMTGAGPNTPYGYGAYGSWGNTGMAVGSANFGLPTAFRVFVAACSGVLGATQTVQLPKVSTSSFLGNAGPVAKTGFTLSLANCVDKANNGEAGNVGYDAHVTWGFTQAGSATVINNTGTSNVKVQILKRDFTTPVSAAADEVIVLANGTNVLQYYAAYVNPTGGAVTPGSVFAQATVTVTYQ